MEISTKEINDIELIAIKGRVDSVESPQLGQVLSAANRRGKYKIVIDMSQLEYISSAGFRALADAQRKSKRHQGGEVVLAHVPGLVHEALELVGFTQYFRIKDDVSLALESIANPPAADSTRVSSLSPRNSKVTSKLLLKIRSALCRWTRGS